MPIDRSGVVPILVFVVIAVVALSVGALITGTLLLASALFLAYFFRDPHREPGDVPPNAVLAAADGRVVSAGPGLGPDDRQWNIVSVFLSPFDVHVNRISADGRVHRVAYVKGRFRPTWLSGSLSANSHNDVWINHGGQDIVLRQIAGVVVRRIECRVSPGQNVASGQRYGIMKFGSRLDVFLPMNSTLAVSSGQRVTAGRTVIAQLVK